MKYWLLTLIIFSIAGMSQTQSDTAAVIDCENVFNLASELPEYPGGDEILLADVQSRIGSLPCVSSKATHLSIMVATNGRMTNPKIIPLDLPQCTEEIVRKLKEFPDFIPGRNRDIAVCVNLVIPLKNR